MREAELDRARGIEPSALICVEHHGEIIEIAAPGPLISNEPDLILSAARDGVGIAYLFENQIGSSLRSGELIHLLADWSPAFPGFHIYYPSRRQMAPALRAFIDFATSSAKAG